MNVLCVGNSFAVNAATYLHQIAEAAGEDINIYVLYIGGCPISLHWKNFLSKDKAYEFYINGNKTPAMWCDIFEGLKYTKYDYITFQQVSTDSGDPKSFFPELTKLMEGVRQYSDATYLLHKTWSYAKYHNHWKYGCDPLNQDAMDKDIKDAYIEVSKKVNIPYIIPSGEAIRLARLKYGDNLNCDGYHMNELGNTLLGILWTLFFSKKADIDLSKFIPNEQVDKKELETLKSIAIEAIKNNKGYNLDD